jgi:hypothetical protein
MRKDAVIQGAEIPGTATAPSYGLRNLTVDDVRAVLALCLAACLLSVYAVACATGAVSI